MNKILVDAFGGDNSPEEVVAGALAALNEKDDFRLVLVGDEEKIKKLYNEESVTDKASFERVVDRVEILHAEDVITCEEEPTVAVRRKPNSSVCVGFKKLKEDEDAKAFVSAGSTGAVLVGATLKLGRISGVNRPALCPILPTVKDGKNVFLLDSGANADCKAINLVQFAVMGTAYAEALGVKNPTCALLSNGTEDEKGNALTHEVFPVLKGEKSVRFVGNTEARDVLSGDFDVVVTDGFSGNVCLKSLECAVNAIFSSLREGIYSSLRGKIGGALLKPAFKNVKNKLDYNEKGGALFLGVNKIVIKAHGSSKRKAIKNAVLQAAEYAELGVAEKIKEKLAVAAAGNAAENATNTAVNISTNSSADNSEKREQSSENGALI